MFSLFGTCTPTVCRCSPSEDSGLPTLLAESKPPHMPPRSPLDAPRRLTVPSSFSRFQLSMIYTQLGATQGTLMEQQRSMLHAILRHFTKEMTRGVSIQAVLDDGRIVEYVCRLDRNMTTLKMHFEGSTKTLALRDIERVWSPAEMRNLRAQNHLHLDECCTTVVLVGQRFATFKLDSILAREYFTECLQVLRMAQEKTLMWYT